MPLRSSLRPYPPNIIGFQGINTLAYLSGASVTKKKRLVSLTPGPTKRAGRHGGQVPGEPYHGQGQV